MYFLKYVRSFRYYIDPVTGDRNYFVWNTERYPTPAELGATLEKRLSVKIIANTKPWLLESHPLFPSAGAIFVQAAKDSKEGDGPQRSVLWSKGFGDHKFGSYIDFSSDAGCSWWRSHVEKEILANNITGIWYGVPDRHVLNVLTIFDTSGSITMSFRVLTTTNLDTEARSAHGK
jgi:alpha-glucosidase (family GH31 glycosyl hydrolase)